MRHLALGFVAAFSILGMAVGCGDEDASDGSPPSVTAESTEADGSPATKPEGESREPDSKTGDSGRPSGAAAAPQAGSSVNRGERDEPEEPAEETESEASTTEAGKPPSKASFVAAVNRLCARDRKKLQGQVQAALAGGGPTGSSPEALANQVVNDIVAPGFTAQVRAIRALPPPSGETAQVEAILAAIERAVADAKRDPLGFIQDRRPFVTSERAADAYGLTACGRL